MRIFRHMVMRDLRLALRQGTDVAMVVSFFVITVTLFPLGVGPELLRLGIGRRDSLFPEQLLGEIAEDVPVMGGASPEARASLGARHQTFSSSASSEAARESPNSSSLAATSSRLF